MAKLSVHCSLRSQPGRIPPATGFIGAIANSNYVFRQLVKPRQSRRRKWIPRRSPWRIQFSSSTPRSRARNFSSSRRASHAHRTSRRRPTVGAHDAWMTCTHGQRPVYVIRQFGDGHYSWRWHPHVRLRAAPPPRFFTGKRSIRTLDAGELGAAVLFSSFAERAGEKLTKRFISARRANFWTLTLSAGGPLEQQSIRANCRGEACGKSSRGGYCDECKVAGVQLPRHNPQILSPAFFR